MDKFLSFIKSKKFIITVVAAIVLLVDFRVGMSLGYHRALFNTAWGQNYYKNFYGMDPRHMPMSDLSDKGFSGMHGTVGKVIDVSTSTISIKGNDNIERSVIIDGDETIRKGTGNILISGLKVGDNIAVIGEPNGSGQIEGRFIRVFPSVTLTASSSNN